MFDRDQPRLPIFRPENLPALVDAEEPSEEILWKLVEGKQVAGALKVGFDRIADQLALVRCGKDCVPPTRSSPQP